VKALAEGYVERMSEVHLRTLLGDEERNAQLVREKDGVTLDFTHCKIDTGLFSMLEAAAEEAKLAERIEAMFKGEKINTTEKRAVLHVALRMSRDQVVEVDGEGDVVKAVWEVRDKIEQFSEKVRSGEFKGYTGKDLVNTIVIGIGGSYLGPEFVFEAMKFDKD